MPYIIKRFISPTWNEKKNILVIKKILQYFILKSRRLGKCSQRASIINDELETGLSSSLQSRQMAAKSVQITRESFESNDGWQNLREAVEVGGREHAAQCVWTNSSKLKSTVLSTFMTNFALGIKRNYLQICQKYRKIPNGKYLIPNCGIVCRLIRKFCCGLSVETRQ